MAKLTCVQIDGQEHLVDVAPGTSVMQAIMSNGVPGLLAECGGNCSCATCHVYIDDRWLDKVPGKSDVEDSMLEGAREMQPNSRLSCQIIVTENLDGLIVHVPKTQL